MYLPVPKYKQQISFVHRTLVWFTLIVRTVMDLTVYFIPVLKCTVPQNVEISVFSANT